MDLFEIILMVVLMLFYVVIIGFAIANYVMISLSLYKLAQRRLINNPWLSWIPIGSDWIMGCLADEYNARNNLKSNWRVALLTLMLLFVGIYMVSYIVLMIWCFVMIIQSSAYPYTEPDIAQFLVVFFSAYSGLLLSFVFAYATSICRSISILKIFESTVPEKSTKYLLLSILVPLACAICLMKCKNKGYYNLPHFEKGGE